MKRATRDEELIRRCRKGDRKAQKLLYERFGPTMKMVCLRYLIRKSLAEEVLNRGFYKVFKNLDEYRGEGSFEGWIRRIMVRESLNENKERKIQYEWKDEMAHYEIPEAPTGGMTHDYEFILRVIEALPVGYRMVFNLAEIEGYNHREIANELGITESTSRSQLARAKEMLRRQLKYMKEF